VTLFVCLFLNVRWVAVFILPSDWKPKIIPRLFTHIFTWYLPKKLTKLLNFTWYFPQNSRIYMTIATKYFFPDCFFWGDTCPPVPSRAPLPFHDWLIDWLLIVEVMLSTELGLEPSFDVAVVNVTVVVGQTAVLPCSIEYLGNFKVGRTLRRLYNCW